MKVTTYQCVSIADVCEHNNLNYDDVMDAISDSEVSYGNNADTLILGSGRFKSRIVNGSLVFFQRFKVLFQRKQNELLH